MKYIPIFGFVFLITVLGIPGYSYAYRWESIQSPLDFGSAKPAYHMIVGMADVVLYET